MRLHLTSGFAALCLIGNVIATSKFTLQSSMSGSRGRTRPLGVPYERLSKNDTVSTSPSLQKPLTNRSGHQVLLIVDLQVGLYEAVRDFDPTVYRNNIMAHAAIGKLFDLPVVMTTSAQTGTLLPSPG